MVFSDVFTPTTGDTVVVFTYSGAEDQNTLSGRVRFSVGDQFTDFNYNLRIDVFGMSLL